MGKEKYARGRSSEIFRLEDGKVLKLFFKEYPESDVTREFENTKIVKQDAHQSKFLKWWRKTIDMALR